MTQNAKNTHNRGRTLPPEPLSPEEVEAIAKVCNPRWPTGARNRAIVLMLAHSGLRCREVLALRPKDYELRRGRMRILRGKGQKARSVHVSGATVAAIQRWVEHRTALGIGGAGPLFCTLEGGEIDPSYLRRLMPRLAKKAGVEKRVHPHGLRHSFAAESIRRGIKINVLSKVLGHANSHITARYIDHIGEDAAVDQVGAVWAE